jgi:hypothetical protein
LLRGPVRVTALYGDPLGAILVASQPNGKMADKSNEKMKDKYFDLMAKRKGMLFEGNEEEAAKLLELAEEMVKRGMVSDDEMIAAAYI